MQIYFTDEVMIYNNSTDPNFRTKTVLNSFESKAYIEENSEIKYNATGQPIDPEVWVFLPPNTEIHLGDDIEIIKFHGNDPTAQESGRRQVKRIHKAGAFKQSHLEVLI
jgi:hypothetical protein